MRRLPTILSLVACAASVAACSGNTVSVTGQPGGSAGPAGDAGNRGATAGAGEHGVAKAAKVFFERVLADDGVPQSVITVSFLPESSHGSAPFGALLRFPQDFGPNPIYVPGSARVIYLRSPGVGADSLVATSLSSWQTQSLFTFPQAAAGFDLSADGRLAWAAADGSAWIASLNGSAEPVPVRLEGGKARSVAWSADGTKLLVRGDADAWVYRVGPAAAAPALTQELHGVAASAFSPSGERLAWVGRADRALRTEVLGSVPGVPSIGTVVTGLDSSEIYDFGWSAQGFSYWARLSGGAQELRTVKEYGGGERTWTRLSVPARVRGGVVCPAWSRDGDELYFSDYVDGEYVIERLGAAGGVPSVFAQPPQADEGFVCPKSE